MTTLPFNKRPRPASFVAHHVPTMAERVGGLALRIAVLVVAVAASAPW